MIVYRCRSCGRVLRVYEGVFTRQPPPTPAEVAERFKWRCPFCGARLSVGGAGRVSVRVP